MLTRNAPSSAVELMRREATFQASSTDEGNRSIEATVVSGEKPVRVWDWSRFAPIDEVLILRGAELPEGVPLLNAHQRWTFEDVLGSVRDWQQGKNAIQARAYFDDDELAQRAYSKAKNGHLRSVSVGYEILASEDIPPGEKASIGGRTWEAGQLWLRIATQWVAREVSVVPIGADDGAMFRQWEQQRARDERDQTKINHRLAAVLTDQVEVLAAELRLERADVVRDLAGALGMPPASVNRILAGHLPCPADRLELIAGVLELPADQLGA